MKIRRYLLTIYDCDVHEDKEGDWVKYEDVKPLLERIEELERYYNGDVVLLLERIKELEERQCDCAIRIAWNDEDETSV